MPKYNTVVKADRTVVRIPLKYRLMAMKAVWRSPEFALMVTQANRSDDGAAMFATSENSLANMVEHLTVTCVRQRNAGYLKVIVTTIKKTLANIEKGKYD